MYHYKDTLTELLFILTSAPSFVVCHLESFLLDSCKRCTDVFNINFSLFKNKSTHLSDLLILILRHLSCIF